MRRTWTWRAVQAAAMALSAAVASSGQDSTERYPEATEVFHCAFGPDTDPNFDRWPTDWIRLRDERHPNYVNIGLSDDAGPDGDSSMLVEMDGGAATIYGPAISVDAQYAYVLEAQVRTQAIEHDDVFLTLIFQDEEGRRVDIAQSPPVRKTTGWQRVLLGPVVPPQRASLRAVIGLQVQPAEGQDIKAKVWFDDLWLARMPRIDLTTNDRHNLFNDPQNVHIRCRVSGVGDVTPALKLEVFDPFGRLMDEAFLDVDQKVKARHDPLAQTSPEASARSVDWHPEKLDYGFYRVRGTLVAGDRDVHERSLTLAVLRPQQLTQRGEFGWSFPRGIGPLDGPRAVDLVRQTGVHWVKLPLWFRSQETDAFDEAVWLIDRFNSFGIRTIGMLSAPPQDLLTALGLTGSRASALLERDPNEWFPAFEPTLLRLALRVPDWQLGSDDETFFVDAHDLQAKVSAVKQQMDRVTHDVSLAIAWPWSFEPPDADPSPWRALSMSAKPELTPGELATFLEMPKPGRTARWVNLAPLPASQYTLADRARDLALRTANAKIHGADRIFLPDPYDPVRGVLDASGSPTEMYLPWRSLAMALSGAKFVGTISLPAGSENYVFARNGKATMLVWNSKEVNETLYLGDQVEQRDLWDSKVAARDDGDAQTIRVGPLPTLVTGLDESVARTQASFVLEATRLPSVPGVPHRAYVKLRNDFPQRLFGAVQIIPPPMWKVSPKRLEVSMGPGEESRRPVDVTLTYDAEAGPGAVRFDFDVNSGRNYQFSVFRTLEIGAGDVFLDLTSRINLRGELEIEQRLENRTPQAVRFKCDLFAPGRRHQRATITQSGPGVATRVFHFSEGQSLIGQTLRMRATELGGPRVFNVRIVAQP